MKRFLIKLALSFLLAGYILCVTGCDYSPAFTTPPGSSILVKPDGAGWVGAGAPAGATSIAAGPSKFSNFPSVRPELSLLQAAVLNAKNQLHNLQNDTSQARRQLGVALATRHAATAALAKINGAISLAVARLRRALEKKAATARELQKRQSALAALKGRLVGAQSRLAKLLRRAKLASALSDRWQPQAVVPQRHDHTSLSGARRVNADKAAVTKKPPSLRELAVTTVPLAAIAPSATQRAAVVSVPGRHRPALTGHVGGSPRPQAAGMSAVLEDHATAARLATATARRIVGQPAVGQVSLGLTKASRSAGLHPAKDFAVPRPPIAWRWVLGGGAALAAVGSLFLGLLAIARTGAKRLGIARLLANGEAEVSTIVLLPGEAIALSTRRLEATDAEALEASATNLAMNCLRRLYVKAGAARVSVNERELSEGQTALLAVGDQVTVANGEGEAPASFLLRGIEAAPVEDTAPATA